MKLALDLGTTTGWAVALKSGARLSGSVDLKPKKHENWAARFRRLVEHLDGLLALEELEGVWYEAVRRHNGTDAAHVYGGFLASLDQWCADCGAPMEGVPVGTIKKFASGKGNASKQQMIEAVEDRFGCIVADDNEADAIALLEYVRR